MSTRNFLRSCYRGPVGRASVYLLGAIFSAGLAFSLTTYAVHDINVFELDNSTTGANAIDESLITDADDSSPDDWAQNNFPDTGICPGGLHSCGYVSGPNVNPLAPGGGAFRSVFIQDPNGEAGDGIFAGGGSKDDLDITQWLWKAGATSSDKTDLLPVGAAAYLNGDLLIYSFGTLFAPNGDAAIGTWLLKKNIGLCGDGSPPGSPFGVVDSNGDCLASQPTNLHSIGDVLVVSENTNGGRLVGMAIYQWVDENTAGGADTAAATAAKTACVSDGHTVVNNTLCLIAEDADAACTSGLIGDDFCGNMNLGETKGQDAQPGFSTESPDDWGYQAKLPLQGFPPTPTVTNPAGTDGIGSDDFPPTTLFEAGFNFSNLFPNESSCFNTFLMNTRASQSVDSVLEDVAIGKFPLCGIAVDKTGPEKSKVGDEVTYTYTITNTGAITLYLDTVVDDVVGDLEAAAVLAGCGTLAPNGSAGDSCTFTADYTVLASDPDPLVNVVTVHYNSSSLLTGDDQTATDDHSVNLFVPSITLDKTGDTLSKAGDDVNYVITLENTSSADTPDLTCTITDPLLGLNKQVTLASGASDVTNAVYTVLPGDPDPLPNTASVSCSPAGFPNVLQANDGHSVELFQPSITIDKTGDTLSKVGDDVDYTITVTNTSSADSPDLNCTIEDPLLGISEPVTLASGANHVINATRTVQAGDPDPLVNTASVTCSPQGFPNVLSDSDDHSVNLFQPSIGLVKTGDELSKVGDDVNYVITLSNTSSADTPDLDCTISDPLLGLNKAVTLASGADDVNNVVYTVLAGDPDPLPNTAGATCSPQGFPNVLQAGDGHEVNLFQPSVAIDKTADCDVLGVPIGADITYTYTITNTSSADSPALNLASINDDQLGSLAADASGAGCDSLASGASCQFTKVVSTSGKSVGPLTNIVDVLYNPAGFPNNITDEDTVTCEIILPNPAKVVIEKVLLDAENVVFDYSDNNLTVAGGAGAFSLTPLFVPVPAQNAASPFAAAGAGNSFATTIEIVVDIPDINQTVQSSVTEDTPLPPFIFFDSLTCEPAVGGSLTGSNVVGETATLELGSGDFAFCRYVNSFQPGNEGCTPGFWKQDFHFGHWLPTGYLPTTELQDVFNFVGVNGQIGQLADDTMLEALNYQGGNGKLGAAQILLRAAVAAVLNAAHPDVQFAFTEAQVIALVDAQLQSGTRDSMLALATQLDEANNGVFNDNAGTESCPLSGQLFLD